MKIGNLIKNKSWREYDSIVFLIIGEEISCGERCFICLGEHNDEPVFKSSARHWINRNFEVVS